MTWVDEAAVATRLSEFVERAAAGETICILRRGKPLAKLTAIGPTRKPVDLEALRALAKTMPRQEEPSRKFMRRMRNEARC